MIMDPEGTGVSAMTIAFAVQRIGPYHHARLRALAADPSLSVHAIEFRPDDSVYSWDPVVEKGRYVRHKMLTPAGMGRVLGEIRPDVAVCVGYADPEIHRVAAWALRRGVPLVACSDSTYDDEPRSPMKEALKRIVISAFDSALVAGSRSHDYLGRLGMNGEAQFRPWDVVDNEYFMFGADAARRAPAEARSRLGMPGRYFVCIARFVAKKNLGALVGAYARYAAGAGDSAWSLVLSGAGPLENELREQVAALGLGARVCFPGFLQYPDLPACYGLAGALVLPSATDQWGLVVNEAMASGLPVLVSSRCGCAPDLVCEGENGHTFEPGDASALADLMKRTAETSPERLAQMGKRSREIIAAYTPQAFAVGLKAALECALARRPRRKSLVARAALGALARRTPGLGASKGKPSGRGPIYFAFADPVGFSGQRAATGLMIDGLSARGWECRYLPRPAFKDSGRSISVVRFMAELSSAWVRDLRLVLARGGWLIVSLGQTRFSFIRDSLPVLLGWAALGRDRLCIVLNGSLFMHWAKDSLDSRVFTFLLARAGTVTVTGANQRDRLIDLGIRPSRVEIVVNSCDAKLLDPESVRTKHDSVLCADRPLRLLYLSSLIDTKGFPEFLEAVQRLAAWGGPAVEAVLCGQITASEFSENFRDPKAAETWIGEKIAVINLSPRAKARWVKGAWGAEKAALFREADIFVLPTRYAVEAQPVALLEAMASGCAIVTTRAGEIATILNGECAVLLDSVSTDTVEEALQTLSVNPDKRLRLAAAAHRRYAEHFGVDRHLDRWESLLGGVRSKPGDKP